jgi:hypothetical protein
MKLNNGRVNIDRNRENETELITFIKYVDRERQRSCLQNKKTL